MVPNHEDRSWQNGQLLRFEKRSLAGTIPVVRRLLNFIIISFGWHAAQNFVLHLQKSKGCLSAFQGSVIGIENVFTPNENNLKFGHQLPSPLATCSCGFGETKQGNVKIAVLKRGYDFFHAIQKV